MFNLLFNQFQFLVFNRFSALIQEFTKLYIQDNGASFQEFMALIPKMQEDMNASMAHMFDNDYRLITESIKKRGVKVDSLILTATFAFNGIYLGYIYRCPVVLFSPIGFAIHWTHFLGNPENPSYQIEMNMPFIEPMTFTRRLVNTLLYFLSHQFPHDLYLLQEKGGMSNLDIENVYSNLSLILQASHVITHNAQALTPNVVDVGGIHCKPAQKLPGELGKFMDKHDQGVVYVSFGSAINPNQMSLERKQAFLDAFKKLKYQVIWKWNEDKVADLPSNVVLTKWTPQQDLLAHPNLKVFVTHGGLLSLQEAIFHQTPLVGVPLGNDQFQNILRAEENGYAVMLDWTNFTADSLYNAIEKAINDPKIMQGIRKANKIFLDQKESPVERAVYWIEYIMRHDGADFLKPKSMGLYWYEYHHVDIILLVFSIFSIIILIIIKLCMCCCRRICKVGAKRKVE